MNPKQEKDDEFERYDEADELRRLIRSLELSEKYFLFFACCNQVQKQDELVKQIKQSLPAKKIEVVKLQQPTVNLLSELREILNVAKLDAVFVQGFERSISSDEDADNLAVVNLNHFRDSFREFLSCPLILWLPEYAIVKITNTAPDFFSVRSGTFYFSSTPEKLTEHIFQSTLSDYKEVSSLPTIEKFKRIEMLEKLLSEYESLPNAKRNRSAEARLKDNLSEIFYSISSFQKAIEYDKQSLAIYREIGDWRGEGSSLNNLGIIYHDIGEYQKAIECHEQSLAISRETGNRAGEGAVLSNLGNDYDGLSEYQKAIECHEQSLAISRETGNRAGESISLGNLGYTYNNLGEYQKAIKCHEQSLAISRATGNRQGEGATLNNLGTTYEKVGEYQKAIECHQQSLAIKREVGDREGEGKSLGNLGNVYQSLGETEVACSLWLESLKIFESIESPSANISRQSLEVFCKS